MKKSVFIIMLILVAVLSVCGNRNGGVKLTDEQLAERFVEDEFPGENLEIKIKESEDKDFVGYPGSPIYSVGRPIFDKVTINLPNGKSIRNYRQQQFPNQ